MQQGGGVLGGSQIQSQYGIPPRMTTHIHGEVGDQSQPVEEASPISSRPPAGNFDELMPADAAAGAAERGGYGCGGGGSTSGNRWPRQETLALIKIRSEMDQVFKDATLKGPLWEDVSRKLAEMGYKRSAKKCKEKFENVHKYYKRTKEGRGGRQHGKSYKFFTELEALHNAATSTTPNNFSIMSTQPVTNPAAAAVTAAAAAMTNIVFSCNAMPVTSVRTGNTTSPQEVPLGISSMYNPSIHTTQPDNPRGISFPSDTASLNHSNDDGINEEDDEKLDEDMEGSGRKRKRGSSPSVGGTRRMMETFENLMRQVMRKQETMQQKFLETIEKTEHDRMIREEAWKKQEMTRLTREHESMAKERALAAQRDAAIVSYLQKITGQADQLPQTHGNIMPPSASVPPPSPQPTAPKHYNSQPLQQPQQQQQYAEDVRHTPSSISQNAAITVPEQQLLPREATDFRSFEGSSSRWPKAEVIALIDLRSKLEARYQEAGPKGPLWEDISAEMAGLGYKRSAKKCKEKWENINKYYKKVKESNKKRPEDAKTCPYFHQLDALYRQKLFGSSSGIVSQHRQEQPQLQVHQRQSFRVDTTPPVTKPPDRSNVDAQAETTHQEKINGCNIGLPGSLFGQDTREPTRPEEIIKELKGGQPKHNPERQQLTLDVYDNMDKHDANNLEEDEYEEEEDQELEENKKMDYKIEFQRQSTSSNGGGNGTPSFLTIFQ